MAMMRGFGFSFIEAGRQFCYGFSRFFDRVDDSSEQGE